jgi:hypothetical protein
MGAMAATGRGEEDFFAVLKLMEELAGVNLPQRHEDTKKK